MFRPNRSFKRPENLNNKGNVINYKFSELRSEVKYVFLIFTFLFPSGPKGAGVSLKRSDRFLFDPNWNQWFADRQGQCLLEGIIPDI